MPDESHTNSEGDSSQTQMAAVCSEWHGTSSSDEQDITGKRFCCKILQILKKNKFDVTILNNWSQKSQFLKS